MFTRLNIDKNTIMRLTHLQRIMLPSLAAVLVSACGEKEQERQTPPVQPSVIIEQGSLNFQSSGGSQTVSFVATVDWVASPTQSWVKVSPPSGQGGSSYQTMTISVDENKEDQRSAEVTISASGASGKITITQQKGAEAAVTINEFYSKKVDNSTWYKITGEIVGIANPSYGNFYIVDNSSYLYVYGLTSKKVASNDQSFSSLGLNVGDKVTFMSLRSEHNGVVEAGGTTPAYYVSHEKGEYKMGRKEAAASVKWMELPATDAGDGMDLLTHFFPDGKQRSYSAYWDYDAMVSHWVAYPLCKGNSGSGGRTIGGDKTPSAFPLDPLIAREKQPLLTNSYQNGNGGSFDRGHQLPQADRKDMRVNIETFFSTNMTPQLNSLNANAWEVLERKVRTWAENSATDTLYVVTGCVTEGSELFSYDNENKKVKVPVGYYKALLRLAKDKTTGTSGYMALAVWMDHKANNATSVTKQMTMSVDDLEKKVGVDFFVNLPKEIQDVVEAESPADVAWWWNN